MDSDKIKEQLYKLNVKYDSMGQDMSSYLDGLLHAKYLHYADYIQLETLLSLQRPRTDFPDELIFIIYHQITELYFKLMNWELKQLSWNPDTLEEMVLLDKVNRLNRYLDNLVHSYEIMLGGMDKNQFMNFRMSLLPASGFQSFQFRLVEIYSTDLLQLVDTEYRERMSGNESLEKQFEHLYWKHGAQELESGKKTLTLKQFEEKYTRKLLRHAHNFKDKNLRQVMLRFRQRHGLGEELMKALRYYDWQMNVSWPLAHFKSAVRYLDKKSETIAATGGTNWQQYLPPRFQKKIFFPELWSEEEKKQWGTSAP